MSTQSAGPTDKETGYAILFGVLATISAAVMYVGATSLAPQLVGAFGFAAVLVFGALTILSIQIYG
ncbi:hypothetical protein ACFQH2_12695 [Natronoarchaeum sp. GCM10025703]|uniref:DUF7525 family protein n=1 Tax=unclassified Natronoarchaeum TaxID=2620183 RepID=UPI00360801E6